MAGPYTGLLFIKRGIPRPGAMFAKPLPDVNPPVPVADTENDPTELDIYIIKE
jgi:hypothetical protein